MNKLRSRLNAGCLLLWTSGIALSLVFKPVNSAIHWIVKESAGLETPPAASTAIEVIALIVMGPLVIGALAHMWSHGVGRTFVQILSFWRAGLKSGIVCLLLALPLIILRLFLRYSAESDVAAPAGWLSILAVVLLLISAPFWALLLIRRLPAAVLRGTLFERFNPEMFDSVGEHRESRWG